MDNRPIGVFDSGLGGLTAVKRMRISMPQEDIVYFGDIARVPYGSRSEQVILKYAESDMRFILEQNIKEVVIACGTVSAVALPLLKQRFAVPILGVLDAAAAAAVRASAAGRIGIIGTAATVRSGAYVRKIRALSDRVETVQAACNLLVPLVENGRWSREDAVVMQVLSEYLQPVLDFGIDTLVLGCTHYPVLEDAVRAVIGDGIRLIDPGAEAADLIAIRQRADGSAAQRDRQGNLRLFVSDTDDGFSERTRLFLGTDAVEPAVKIDIDRY